MSSKNKITYKDRGVIDEEKAKKYEAFLGHPLTLTEMRLVPYVCFCATDQSRIDREKVSREERAILKEWTDKGWCVCFPFNVEVVPSREFWEFMCGVLWDFYCNELAQDRDA